MRYGLAIVVFGLAGMGLIEAAAQRQQHVSIRVDTAVRKGPMITMTICRHRQRRSR